MTLEKSAARLADPATYADPDSLNEIFTELRRSGRIVHTEPEGMRSFWAVTKAADIRFVETNSDKFIAEPWPAMLMKDQEQKNIELFGSVAGPSNTLVSMDGEIHHKHRLIAQEWFMPHNVRKLTSDVDAIARTYIEKMSAMDGECDFARDIAFWYPLRVVNSILGLPESVDADFLRLTQLSFGAADPNVEASIRDRLERFARAHSEFMSIFRPVIEDRRANPTDDLASAYSNATIDGEPLGEAETLGLFLITATAGHDTTSATTAGGLKALIEHPEQFRKLRGNMDLLRNAIEEFLRWVTPVKHFARTATEDVQFGDQTVREGERVVVFFASACRDEEVFDDPFVFRIDRDPNKHLAFGTGPHLCLGMHLARLEMRCFFEQLLPRLKHIELAGDATYLQANLVSGLTSLPVKYELFAGEHRATSQ